MRISDWSSDVCSSDLVRLRKPLLPRYCAGVDRLRRRAIAQVRRRVAEIDTVRGDLDAAFAGSCIEATEHEGVEHRGKGNRRILGKGILERERAPCGEVGYDAIGKRQGRSEESRVGKEVVRDGRSR